MRNFLKLLGWRSKVDVLHCTALTQQPSVNVCTTRLRCPLHSQIPIWVDVRTWPMMDYCENLSCGPTPKHFCPGLLCVSLISIWVDEYFQTCSMLVLLLTSARTSLEECFTAGLYNLGCVCLDQPYCSQLSRLLQSEVRIYVYSFSFYE